MKKIFLFIICLLFITSNSSFAFSQQELRDFETTLQNDKQTILRDFTKENKSLTQEELTKALSRTRSELLSLVRMERMFDVKTDNVCYSNGVIKQTTIISPDGSITYHYFNIYGIEVGSLTYKNNKLIASTRPSPNSQIDQQIVLNNNGSSTSNSKDSKIYSIGGERVVYQGDKIYSIGGKRVVYQGDKIYSIDGKRVVYQGDKIYSIDGERVVY